MSKIKSNTENADQLNLVDKLNGMTHKELQAYANLTFGLAMKASHTKEDFINAILQSNARFQGNEQIEHYKGQDIPTGKARIKMSPNQSNKKGHPVVVGLNGTMYTIPVSVEVLIPIGLVEILDNAIRFEYDQNPETLEMERREVHSYPFALLGVGS